MSGFQPETSIWLVPHRLQRGRSVPLSSSNTTTFSSNPLASIPQQNYVYAYPVPDPHYHEQYSSYAYSGIPVRFANSTPANQEYVRNTVLEELINNDRLNRINQNQNQSVDYVDDVTYYNIYTPSYDTVRDIAEFEVLVNRQMNRIMNWNRSMRRLISRQYGLGLSEERSREHLRSSNRNGNQNQNQRSSNRNRNQNQSNENVNHDAASINPANQENAAAFEEQLVNDHELNQNRINGRGSGLSEERIRWHLRVETHHAAVGKRTMVSDDDDGGCCCIICLDGYEENAKIARLENCGHRYHWECISKWLLVKNVCPICRSTAITV